MRLTALLLHFGNSHFWKAEQNQWVSCNAFVNGRVLP